MELEYWSTAYYSPSKSIFVLNYLCSSNMPKSRQKVLTLFFISVINLWPEYCKTLQRDSLKFRRDNFNAFSKLNILTWNVQISTSTNLMFPYFHPQFDRSPVWPHDVSIFWFLLKLYLQMVIDKGSDGTNVAPLDSLLFSIPFNGPHTRLKIFLDRVN